MLRFSVFFTVTWSIVPAGLLLAQAEPSTKSHNGEVLVAQEEYDFGELNKREQRGYDLAKRDRIRRQDFLNSVLYSIGVLPGGAIAIGGIGAIIWLGVTRWRIPWEAATIAALALVGPVIAIPTYLFSLLPTLAKAYTGHLNGVGTNYLYRDDMLFRGYMTIMLVVGLGLAVWWIYTALGLLRRQPSALVAATRLIVIYLVLNGVQLLVMLAVLFVTTPEGPRGYTWPSHTAGWERIFFYQSLVTPVIGAAFNAGLLWLVRRPSVIRAYGVK